LKLTKAKAGKSYLIIADDATGKARARLDSLGLVVGTSVYVITSSYAGTIVDIKGSRLAICKSVTDQLHVEESAETGSITGAAVSLPASDCEDSR